MLWIFIAVAALMLFVGWLAGRKKGDEEYNIYGRKLPKLLYAATYAASYMGAGFLVVSTAYVYTYGLGLLWFMGGLFAGFCVFGFFSAWLHKKTAKKRFYTLPEYFRSCFGKKSARTLVILQLLLIGGELAVQLISGGKLMEQLGVAPFVASIILTVVIVGIYLLVSGFRAVVWTDLVLLAGIFLITLIVSGSAGTTLIGGGFTAPTFDSFPIALIIAMFIFGIVVPFGNGAYYQRVFAAKSAKDASHGTWLSAIWVIIPSIALFILGYAARVHAPGIDPDAAFFAALNLSGPTILYLGSLLLWACLMSTTDTYTFIGSQILTADLLKRKLTQKNMRLGLIIVLGVGTLISFLIPSLVDLTVLFFGGSITIGLPAFLHWFLKLSDRAVSLAMILSVIIMTIYAIISDFNPLSVFVAMVVSLVTLLAVRVVERIMDKRTVKHTGQ